MSSQIQHSGLGRSRLYSLACFALCMLQSAVGEDYLAKFATSFKAIGPVEHATMSLYGGKFDKMIPNTPSWGVKEGSCGYELLPKNAYPWWHACAIDPVKFGGKDIRCGACYRITGPNKKSIVVVLTDSCPGCNKHFKVSGLHFDCQALTYNALAPGGFGFARIAAQRVECRPPGGIHFKVTGYSGPYQWLRIVPMQAAGNGIIRTVFVECNPVKIVFKWAPKKQRMKATWGAAYEVWHAPGGSKCRFILTDDSGKSVTTEYFDLKKYKGKTYKSKTNFPISKI